MIGQTNKKVLKNRLQRTLRSRMTDAEQMMWKVLRNRQVEGLKFRRQHPFADYILDFVCLDKRLVIEVDGGQHEQAREYDERRTQILNGAGFRVLRFWNTEVLQEIEAVKEHIWTAIQELDPIPHPTSPLKGEELKA
jgi:very-short-patch-repair endonuclease